MKKITGSIILALSCLTAHAGTTWYVATNSMSDGPGTAWSNAFHTIQQAVDMAHSNDTVLVTNGIYNTGSRVTPGYSCLNRLVITNDIAVNSVNGPEVTIINGADSVRGVYMSAGLLAGFTIRNCSTADSGNSDYDRCGGGVNLYDGSGMVSNCVISNNSAAYIGGGTYYGTVNNCAISDNTTDESGGGSGYGTLNDCTIINNTTRFSGGGNYYGTLNNCKIIGNTSGDAGGGSYHGTLTGCTVSSNTSVYGGGGTYYATLANCTINGNHADRGGGSYGGTLDSCVLSGNTSKYDGGGSYYGTLNNCAINRNSAGYTGGGSYHGALNNCTITANTAEMYGGGSRWGVLHNCIIYYNTAKQLVDNYSNGTIEYSCTTPLPYGGNSNITNAPHLISTSHILADSPCVGKGSLSYSSGTDIDGDNWNSPPSMGCDEPLAPYSGNITVAIDSDYTSAVPGYKLSFRADIQGEISSNRWTFGDGNSRDNQLYVEHSWTTTGDYPVVLTAWNDDHPDGVAYTANVHIIDARHYVDADNPVPAYPYSSWQTAATNIQDAVDAASGSGVAGARVIVTNGVYDTGCRVTPGYTSTNRLVITNNIEVSSVNGPKVTIIDGSNSVRGVYMSDGQLTGFTIRNGRTLGSGDYDYDQSGGGINLYGGNGTVNDCIICGNSASECGGGTCFGTLNRCTIVGNISGDTGGGIYDGTLNNCVIIDNKAHSGGGCDSGTLNNCTIVGNTAESEGGGVFFSTLHNCVVYYNKATSFDNDNWYGATIDYSCTTPTYYYGSGNITNAPHLISTSHILADSPCVGKGNSAYISGTDIDGENWNSPPSMGCDEPLAPYSGDIAVSIDADYTSAVPGYKLSFRANIQGEISSNRWSFGDGGSTDNQLYIDHTWSTTGNYPLVLTAWNDDHPGGVAYTATVHIIDARYYVDAGNSSPVYPYTSWQTAATNIQDAVDAATGKDGAAGATVIVTNGVYDTGNRVTPGYACLNRVIVTNDIILRSVNGPEVTVIDGSNSVRCVYMSDGQLIGFTIRNGRTASSGSWDYDRSGGGINMHESNCTISNCILRGNYAYGDGGGSYDGTLYNCTIVSNTAHSDGGGSCDTVLNDCTLSGNTADDDGGGSYGGTLSNCVIRGNAASGDGGGISFSKLYNCAVRNNTAGGSGGGSDDGKLYNCEVSGNSASSYGGGCYESTLVNCTVCGNKADYGGGTCDSDSENSIIYYNTATTEGDNGYSDQYDDDRSYCCTLPMPYYGRGNITNSPLFVDYAATNFHLAAGSPCIDAGDNDEVVGEVDLDGDKRIRGSIVDMGAYEYIDPFDIDDDGLPNNWETEYFGDPTNADPNAICSNGINKVIDAYVAGFDPNNPNTFFDIHSAKPVSEGFVLTWNSVSGRTYNVYWATNLMNSFQPLQTNLEYPVNSYTDTLHNNDNMRFYKLRVYMKNQ